MPLDAALSLGGWENFYVIVGSSAGALTGLTFIVITIAADMPGSATARLVGLRAFTTPTAVHFGAALWIAALMSMPGHSRLSLMLCLGATGLIGTAYCGYVARLIVDARLGYQPVLSDWSWSLLLPLATYLLLLIAALLMRAHLSVALYTVAAVGLLLLLLGLHNAWDVVVWITTERHTRSAGTADKGGVKRSSPGDTG